METTFSQDSLKNTMLQIINAFKMLQIYPSHHSIPQQAISQAHSAISDILAKKGSIYLKFSRMQVLEGNTVILENIYAEERFRVFIEKLLSHGISSVIIFHGLNKTELLTFLNMLSRERKEIEQVGGPSAYLSKAGIEHIKVNEIPKEVSFDERGDAKDVSEAKKSEEAEILEILSSILLKDNFTEEDLKLVGHLLNKPKDLRTVLYHIYEKGGKGGGSINLLEKIVVNLSRLIIERKLLSSAELEGLISAFLTLPLQVSGKLLANIIFSAVRSVTAKDFLESISPEQVANLALQAHDNDIVKIEKLSLSIENTQFDPNYKEALIDQIKQGLIERGYSKEESEVIAGGKGQEIAEISEGEFTSVKNEDFAVSALKASDIEESPADARLLEYLQLEAKKFRADSHIFRCLLSMLPFVTKKEIMNEIHKSINMLLPSILESEDFDLLVETANYLNEVVKKENPESKTYQLAKSILHELYLEKTIYQIFEKMVNAGQKTHAFKKAKELLNALPRDIVISALIKILGSEEMLSRRKLLVSLLSDLGSDRPDLIGSRISSSSPKWFLVRNLCTILGQIGKPECINYLKEAMNHQDIRVKKEAIKAIASIGGKEAFDAISEQLSNADPDYRKFLLKHIGYTGCKEALSVLLPIVEKRDIFLRDYEEKMCAIESLSKVPHPQAISALEKLSNYRNFLFRRKAKAISEAASNALKALRAHKEVNKVEELSN